ncbi:Crp/Fnr family transcriptional regulator [Taibaiella koreensis]|uniref:Crp/Fnr family transcriptional regulator n=1 Tax=Taibaiella koreensis TaxID=1268548 RepID=UPI000E5A0328|nr:Crp/Fnr family transcriptional regulator [Taibaiella koreensis]
MTPQLRQHIATLVPGIAIAEEALAPFFQTRSVKKGALLLSEGAPCNEIYFVNSGCLYLFYEHEGQGEVIHFALEHWWLTDYKTFADNKPAVFAIAAMEDSEITYLSRSAYDALLLQFPLMAVYFNKIHERAYGAALFKQKTFGTMTREDFYRYFSNTYPHLIRRIPAPLLASYIGISTEALKELQAKTLS